MEIEKNKDSNEPDFAFKSVNYQFMLVGIAVLLIGFVVMSMDKEPYGFGFYGLTLGPAIVMIGFIFQYFAIFKK